MQFIVYLFEGVRAYSKAIEHQRVLLENPLSYLVPVLHDDNAYRAFIVADFNETEMVTTADLTRLRDRYVKCPLGRMARVVFTTSNQGRGIGLLKETVGELDLGATARRLFYKTPMFVCAPLAVLRRSKDAGTTETHSPD